MVIQKAINNLKEKPKDERKAVAGGIAIAIVIILFFGWAFLFFKKIQHGAVPEFENIIPEEFSSPSVREAQEQLLRNTPALDELRTVREQSAEQYQPPQQESYTQSETDVFGQPATSE